MKLKGDEKTLKKVLLLALIFLLVLLSFKILQPYLIVILSSFILAYLVKPLYKRISPKFGNSFSAIICIFLLFVAIVLPLGAIIGGVSNQAYELVNQKNVVEFFSNISNLPIIEKLNIDLSEIIKSGTSFVISLLSSFLSYLPSLIISILILFFGIYYILTGWDEIIIKLKGFLPFKNKEKTTKEIDSATKGIIYGSFLIALIQFAVSAIGFYLSGVKAFLLLPALIFFLAFIPSLGPTIVWVPLAIYYLLTQNWGTFIGVLITGVILSIYADTILRSKILGGKSDINPFVMLVGILGGISLFGIFGFVIGPLVLVYTLKILEEIVR